MRYMTVVVLAAVLVALVAGCGGGGSSTVAPTGTGSLTGRLSGVTSPASFQILVDGSPTSVTPAANGSFTIANVPAGAHTVSFIARGGMVGAHVNCDVNEGSTTDVGDVVPVQGGQIAGLVMRKASDGTLTPLAGVEVLADSDPPVYIEPQQGTTDPPVTVPPSDGDSITLSAITDANGSYVIPAVPEGAYVVTVNVPGLLQGSVWVYVTPGTTAVADFQLEEAIDPGVGTVQGTILGVTQSGTVPVDGTVPVEPVPLEGALVTIYTDQPWTSPTPTDPIALPAAAKHCGALAARQATGYIPPVYQFQEFSTLTDAAGHYSLNVPSGYVTICVYRDGYDGASERFALHAGEVVTKDYTLNVWLPVPEPQPVAQ